MQKKQSAMGDDLCKWCPLEKKGAYSVPGGFMAGCEGSRCSSAYEAYLEECAAELAEQNGHIAQQIK